jgi:hypothetical protein
MATSPGSYQRQWVDRQHHYERKQLACSPYFVEWRLKLRENVSTY